jgi:site-specific DNA recombinase
MTCGRCQFLDEDPQDRILQPYAVMKRTKVLGYTRVSTSDQADHGISIDDQRARIEAYVAAYPDLELVGIEVDAGESASTLERPALQRALGKIRVGRDATALLVVEMSRLTRSVRDLQTLIAFFVGRRSLIAVSESVDTRSPDGRLRLNIMASVHQHARESGAARTASAMQHLRAQGRYTGGRPRFGYVVGVDGEMLVADPTEQTIIARVRELRARGLTLRGIVTALHECGVRSRAGRPFALPQIARMLAA